MAARLLALTTHRFTTVAMDTLVSIQVVAEQPRKRVEPAVQRAFGWFETVERTCSRFEPASEVTRLTGQVGRPVPASTLLLEVLGFALELAHATGGAFDPTIGARLERRGFNRSYRTGAVVSSGLDGTDVSYRDVVLDRRRGTVMLRRPLVLDLGAVAKGLAIDLAAQELRDLAGVCIEAGGDVYARGQGPAMGPWRIGIQHPRAAGLERAIVVSDAAVCTSGDYERPSKGPGHHIVDARTGVSPVELASVSVLAPTALAADGLSTAAMLLGREQGLELLERHGVAGLLLADDGSASVAGHGFEVGT